MTTVYLAGNMDGLTEEEMRGWREEFKTSPVLFVTDERRNCGRTRNETL